MAHPTFGQTSSAILINESGYTLVAAIAAQTAREKQGVIQNRFSLLG
jgi:hypothetical protein